MVVCMHGQKGRENSLQTHSIERAAVYRQQPPAEKLQANVAQSEGLKKLWCSIAVDPHGSLRFQNFCGCERSSFSYGYRRSSSINARYMAWNIGLTVTASEGVCFCVFFLSPGVRRSGQINSWTRSIAQTLLRLQVQQGDAAARRTLDSWKQTSYSKRPPPPLNDPQSQSRVGVGASSKRGVPFLFSLVGQTHRGRRCAACVRKNQPRQRSSERPRPRWPLAAGAFWNPKPDSFTFDAV